MESSESIVINHRTFGVSNLRTLELHADFACSNCGRCCRGGWNIVLQTVDYQRVAKALAQGGMPQDQIERSFIPTPSPLDPDSVRLVMDAEGTCIFCGWEEGQSFCKIQRTYGHEALATICQSFPRTPVGTASGVYLTLSYTCPTAARLLLKENGLRETSPRGVFAARPQMIGFTAAEDVPAPRFSKDCRPPWAVFDYFWRWTPEWMANPAMSPAQALYGLGSVVGYVESMGAKGSDLSTLIDLLDEAARVLPRAIGRECEKTQPVTELGVIYLDIFLNLMQQVSRLPQALKDLWDGMREGGERLQRERVIAEYDRLIRPRLAEFERIERNFIASRLYANSMAYQAQWLRTGYFVVVLTLIAYRFAALAICLREGIELDEEVWLRAAGLTDHLLQHHPVIQSRFLDLLEQNIQGDLRDLALPAIF